MYNQDFILNEIEGFKHGMWPGNVLIPKIEKKDVYLVGDKTGHRTVEHLIGAPHALDELKQKISWPIKWIHVVRNPYDNLATWTKKNHESRTDKANIEVEFNIVFQKYKALNEKIGELKATEDVLTINHERVIKNVDKTLDELCNFLEIEKYDDWRARVIKAKWSEPRITRRNIKWTPEMRAKAAKLTKQYQWLNGYAFGG
jgi:hypothetical protein